MFPSFRQFFDSVLGQEAVSSSDPERELRVATAALFIEVSRADFQVTSEERRAIVSALERVLGLSDAEVVEILRLADAEVDRSVSIYEFTRVVDTRFTAAQKKDIMKRLWLVALSDSVAEKHEEHVLRKIAYLIHLHHEDFIAAKLAARRMLGTDNAAGGG